MAMGGLQLNIVQNHKAAILKAKFETEIPKQTWVTLPKPCRPETENLIWPQGSHLENEVIENQ